MSFAYKHSPYWEEANEKSVMLKKRRKVANTPFMGRNEAYAKFIKDNDDSPYFILTRALCQNQLRTFLANEDRLKTKIRRFFDSSFQNYFLGALLVEHQLSSKNGTLTPFGIPHSVLIDLMKGSLSSKRRAISTAKAEGYIYTKNRTENKNQIKVFATEATINDFIARAVEYHDAATAEDGDFSNWHLAHSAHAELQKKGKHKIDEFLQTINAIGNVKNGK